MNSLISQLVCLLFNENELKLHESDGTQLISFYDKTAILRINKFACTYNKKCIVNGQIEIKIEMILKTESNRHLCRHLFCYDHGYLNRFASSMNGRFWHSVSSFHSAPSRFDISELCIFGLSWAIFRRWPRDHTMNAFIGRFMWSLWFFIRICDIVYGLFLLAKQIENWYPFFSSFEYILNFCTIFFNTSNTFGLKLLHNNFDNSNRIENFSHSAFCTWNCT